MEKEDAWEGKQEVATEAAKKHGRKTRPRKLRQERVLEQEVGDTHSKEAAE